MAWKLEFRPAARLEFDEAADWFKERSPEVRGRFVSFVGKTISAITQRPYAFPVVFGSKIRRAKVSKFKY